jgi:hypothetical protein
MKLAIALVAIAAGCSKKADECQRVIDKSAAPLTEIARLRGKELTADDRKTLVDQCRKALAKGQRDPSVDCVLAAKTDAMVRDCYMKGYEQYLARSKSTEATLMLNKLAKSAKTAFVTNAAYPTGSAGPTPATPCCAQPDKRCAPNPADWADPTWRALDVSIDEPFRFQYSYQSDGKTFTATAVGDPACDGKTVTHTAKGAVTADGTPQVSMQ